jgi:hypothetical protein
MYGLPQAGIIVQELLETRLLKAGYTQSKITPGYWKHEWRPISFTLVVDDFGVKYIGAEHVQHILQVLKQDYEIEEDWEGTCYLGITIDWDYKKREVHLSMPGYVKKALAQFCHRIPERSQHQPHKHTIPSYGATIQCAKPEDTTRLLSKEEKKYIQQVIGTFLYYGRAVDSTMLTTLSSIASTQAEPTEETMSNIHFFLDYAATHQDAIITYRASDMVLIVHSNASYLSEPKAQSRAGGHFFMSSNTKGPREQWRCTQHCPAHQGCDVVGSRSQTWSALHQRVQGGTPEPTSQRNGPSTTAHAYANRQQHGTRRCHKQHPTATNEGDGHAFSLAQMP